MESNGFTFEIIVPRLTTKKECLDPSKLSVDVNFHRIALTATCSRINLSEFPDKPGFDFYAALEELKYMVTNTPILFIVKYEEEVLGISETTWPQTALTHIHSAMVEIFHMGECELTLDDQAVGSMEFVMRILKHCDNFEKQLSALELNSNLRELVKREDILLMMANDPNFRCNGMSHEHQNDERYSQHRTSGYDEKDYQKSENKESCPNPRACEIAKLIEMLNQVGSPKNDCTFEKIECHDCVEGLFDTDSDDSSFSDDDRSCPQYDAKLQSEIEKPCWFCPNDLPPPPVLTQTIFRAPRRCLVCKQNMAWLPKFAACPNCGYKPMPLPKEVAYNDKLTAEEIVEEYRQNVASCSEADEPVENICADKMLDKQAKCRCKCDNGNSCAFCRIQKLAEEMMMAARGKSLDDNELKCGKCETDPSKLFNTCKDNECRPFLARVFSELRLLYDVGKPKEPKKLKINELCEKQLKAIFQKKIPVKSESKKNTKDDTQTKTVPKKDSKQQQIISVPKDKHNQEKKEEQRLRQHNVRKLRGQQLRIPTYGPHKKCFNDLKRGKNVPRSMGWLWTADPRPKWRPGFIGKKIRRIMHYFLEIYPTTTPEAKRLAYEHCKKICEERKVIPPTLRVEKKADAYYITLYRQENPASLQDCMSPCDANGKPITFKIVKHPKLILYRHLKRKFKDMGFEKCVCHKPISECICRTFLDKKRLEFEVKKECCRRQIPCVNNDLILSKTSLSEADIDFEIKPPAAVVKPPTKKPVKMVNNGTQYVSADTIMPSSKSRPKPVNQFLATYDCAVGEKYGKPRFIPQPGQVIPGMEWKKAVQKQKRAERAAILANKKYKIGKVKERPVEVQEPLPFGEKGPPKISKDGIALDEQGKPMVDSEGNTFKVVRGLDGSIKVTRQKKKSMNMIKYLVSKGLIVPKPKGRNKKPQPPGDLSPEYLKMQRALRRKKYRELLEQTPLPVCMVDRLGKPCPNYYFEC